VGYDEWLVPTSGFTGGSAGAFEVFIMTWEHFGGTCTGGGASFVTSFVEPTTVNGTLTSVTWKEYAWGTGPGNEIIFCPSSPVNGGYSSGEVSFNAIDFFKKAIADSGGGVVTNNWWIPGVEYGSEWGVGSGGSGPVNYTLTTTKLAISTSAPSAPPGGIVQ
jgi:hypothetical protein